MENGIQNLNELRGAIIWLNATRDEQKRQLATHVRSPEVFLQTTWSLYRWRMKRQASKVIADFTNDPVSAGSQLILPIVVLKCFFKRLHFLTKAAIGLMCRKLATLITLKRAGIMISGIERRLRKQQYEHH